MTSLGDKVRVKPLEWDDLTGTGTRFRSYDGLKSYTISRIVQDNVAYFRWARSQGGWSGVFYDADACKAAAQADYEARILAALDLSPPVVEEGLTSRLAAWFNALPDGGMGKEHFDALLAIVGASPVPKPQAVAWRYRYEETGEDNEMIWSDWIVVKWKPNRSVFSTKVEIEPLAPLSGGGGKDNTTNSTGDTAEQRVTDEAIDRAIKAYCDEPSNDMRDMMRAALSTMGGKP